MDDPPIFASGGSRPSDRPVAKPVRMLGRSGLGRWDQVHLPSPHHHQGQAVVHRLQGMEIILVAALALRQPLGQCLPFGPCGRALGAGGQLVLWVVVAALPLRAAEASTLPMRAAHEARRAH